LYIITCPDPVPSVTPFTVSDPLIVVSVFTLNPLFGDIDADTDPDDIWDKFRPTIPDAGMSYRFAPEPEKLDDTDWATIRSVTFNEPVTVELFSAIIPLRATNSLAMFCILVFPIQPNTQ